MSIDPDSAIELLTIGEVAKLLRISVVGVRRLQQQRRIPFVKVGGSIRITKSDLVFYLTKNRIETID
jgi:excisionase family DNA binding protein